MDNGNVMHNGILLKKLFYSLLPIQILILVMATVNSLINGIFAGMYIGAEGVAVIGFYSPMTCVMSAFTIVLLAGVQILAGEYIGAGRLDKTCGIFSLDVFLSIIIGGALSILFAEFPKAISFVLGVAGTEAEMLNGYIRMMAIGFIPLILGPQFAAFLQLELQKIRCYVGIVAMIVSNLILNYVFLSVYNMGVAGQGLATALSNWVFMIVVGSYYLGRKTGIRFSFKNILWEDLTRVIKIGLPAAVIQFCIAFRGMIQNWVILTYVGQDGITAVGALSFINGLLCTVPEGIGSVTRILSSVGVGERDRVSLRQVVKTVFANGMPIVIVETLVTIILSGFLTRLFVPEADAAMYSMVRSLMILYSVSLPFILFKCIFMYYFQSMERVKIVHLFSFIDGFAGVVLVTLALAPVMGAIGIWLSFPLGVAITCLSILIYSCVYNGKIPRSVDEWLALAPDFGVDEDKALTITINDMEGVSNTSSRIIEFCKGCGISGKTSNYSGLCAEEMAGNVVQHGFNMDNKRHFVQIRVMCEDNEVTLQIKDDCKAFDPQEMTDISMAPVDDFKNIGIRLVYGLAESVRYQNMMGLNLLSIKLKNV